jgi:cytochrome c556
VPYDEKDKIYKAFHKAVDNIFDTLKIDDNNRPVDVAKLRRTAEKLRNDIKTAENNILFLAPANSKKQSPLLDEMNKNIEKMKKELQKILKTIESNEKKA